MNFWTVSWNFLVMYLLQNISSEYLLLEPKFTGNFLFYFILLHHVYRGFFFFFLGYSQMNVFEISYLLLLHKVSRNVFKKKKFPWRMWFWVFCYQKERSRKFWFISLQIVIECVFSAKKHWWWWWWWWFCRWWIQRTACA